MTSTKEVEGLTGALSLDGLDDDTKLQMKDFFATEVSTGKSAWAMTVETLGMAEGSSSQKDIYAPNLEKGMLTIKAMLNKVKKDTGHKKFKFDLVPLKHFNATMNDVLRAFVMWSRKEEESRFNVTKAFRRLESYATWMDEHRDDLKEPFTVKSIRKVADAWKFKLTYDAKGRVVWWLDLGTWDIPSIKNKIPPRESLRFVFWICHLVMFDPKAQKNGIIFVESLGKKGMYETFTMVPMDLGTQMDRLTIGVLPLRCKAIYTFNHLRWMSILVTVFKPFMSAKMRQRVIVIPRSEDPGPVIEKEVGGKAAIPAEFADLKGGKVKEDIFVQFLKKKEAEEENEKGFDC
mmetsp:Transcript_18901/g.27978  ORF Transcript_18901/g.27978 Transcript_18901/m.27978 type:complete len:347 (+) Transcript_18901:51-1091(+)|eukprot:CAMPEP_0194202524 /NCGR_PEP_ID=MMETSP0156-20130528/2522_1 /TAXON_ID=33649 /ORGANISM="Thalassionema nitzschioides, Strain L26-B" /LENGTH=346 /DNA_ID=CAMNT_0038928037 /DNA_START=51 /DNA_END=1091 /DNA_ORIENTATION=-